MVDISLSTEWLQNSKHVFLTSGNMPFDSYISRVSLIHHNKTHLHCRHWNLKMTPEIKSLGIGYLNWKLLPNLILFFNIACNLKKVSFSMISSNLVLVSRDIKPKWRRTRTIVTFQLFSLKLPPLKNYFFAFLQHIMKNSFYLKKMFHFQDIYLFIYFDESTNFKICDIIINITAHYKFTILIVPSEF